MIIYSVETNLDRTATITKVGEFLDKYLFVPLMSDSIKTTQDKVAGMNRYLEMARIFWRLVFTTRLDGKQLIKAISIYSVSGSNAGQESWEILKNSDLDISILEFLEIDTGLIFSEKQVIVE